MFIKRANCINTTTHVTMRANSNTLLRAEALSIVVHPRKGTNFRKLGEVLEKWQAEVPQAKCQFGLYELLVGECPITPAIVLGLPVCVDARTGEPVGGQDIPVALIYAHGIARKIMKDLYERLKDFDVNLFDANEYSRMMR
jgi:hypothetical protein